MNLREALRQRVWIADGAMGTRLFSKGVGVDCCLEELNLSRPALIEEIHREYRAAGANFIETNTFGANAIRLASHGLGKSVTAINSAAVRLARAAAGRGAIVAGAVGPLGDAGVNVKRDAFAAQIRALAEAEADCIVLETFRDLAEILDAIAAAKSACSLPVIAQVSSDDDGRLAGGMGPEVFVRRLIEAGADAIGCNCGSGPGSTLAAIRSMSAYATVPLTAHPSAGLPVITNETTTWPCSPGEMAPIALQMVHNGVRVIGGCCGTTPEHIRAIRNAVVGASG
jgi:homocysteine S-methyltransferase